MNLPQPQSQIKQHLETSPKRHSKVLRASTILGRRILDGKSATGLVEGPEHVNGSCGRANAVAFCQGAWGNRHFQSIEMIQNRKYMKILLQMASELEVTIILTSPYELMFQAVWLQIQPKDPPYSALQLRMCRSPWMKRFPFTSMAPPLPCCLWQPARRSSAPGWTTPSFSRWTQGPSNGRRTAITERFPWKSTDSLK